METKASVKVRRDNILNVVRTALKNCFEIGLVIVAIIITFVAVNCGGLSSPMNGSISGNLTVYPNIVTFSCDPGFILRGSSVRKCQSKETWDGYETNCEGTMSKRFSGQILLNAIAKGNACKSVFVFL